MGYKNLPGNRWANLELQGLLEDEDSHVKFEKIQQHLSLHPYQLNNLQAALNEILDSKVNCYDSM